MSASLIKVLAITFGIAVNIAALIFLVWLINYMVKK